MSGARSLAHLAATAAIAVLVALPPASPAAELPPINEPSTGDYQRGKLVWVDLFTADLAGARRFYGGLFGWAFAELGEGRGAYTVAYQAGLPVGGLVQRKPLKGEKRQARWVAFISVADVAGATRMVTGKGGQVLIAPARVPARGEMAVLADPDGAPFGVVNSASGDPPDTLPEEGDWIWALYQSPDATSAAAFYQDLGDYEVVPDDRLAPRPHFLLVAGGYARASLVEIPVERSGLRPDWLYFVRVRSVAASLARAVELGGAVVMEPSPAVLDGRLAVITDPAGAPLGLMEWEAAASEDQ